MIRNIVLCAKKTTQIRKPVMRKLNSMDKKPPYVGLSSQSSNDSNEKAQDEDNSEDTHEDACENGEIDVDNDVQQDVSAAADNTSLVGEDLCLSPVPRMWTPRQRGYDLNEFTDLYQRSSYLRGLYSELTTVFPEATRRPSILDDVFQQFEELSLMVSSVFPEANRRHLLPVASAMAPRHGSNRVNEQPTLDMILYEFPERSRRHWLPASHRRNGLGKQRHFDRVFAPSDVLALINSYMIQQLTSRIMFTYNVARSNENSLVPVRLLDQYTIPRLRMSTGYTWHHRCRSCTYVVSTGDASFAGPVSVPRLGVNERGSSLPLVASDNNTTSPVASGSELSVNDGDSSLPLIQYATNVASLDAHFTGPVSAPYLDMNDGNSLFPPDSTGSSGALTGGANGFAGPASLLELPVNDTVKWSHRGNEISNAQAGHYHQVHDVGHGLTRNMQGEAPQVNHPGHSSTRSSLRTRVEGRCSGRGCGSWLSFKDGHCSSFDEPNDNCSFHETQSIAVSFTEAQFHDLVPEVTLNGSPLAQETDPAVRNLPHPVQERSDTTNDVNLDRTAPGEDQPEALATDIDRRRAAVGGNGPHSIATDVDIHDHDPQEDLDSLGVRVKTRDIHVDDQQEDLDSLGVRVKKRN